MTRRLLWMALAATLVLPAVAGTTQLTIYHAQDAALFSGTARGTLDAGHALVHETRAIHVAAGNHAIRIDDLPATLDPEAIAISFGSGPAVDVLGQRVQLADASTGGALDGALGNTVSVSDDLAGNAPQGRALQGVLVGASGNGLLLRTADGKVHLIHRYASVTLPAGTAGSGSALVLDVDARATGTRSAQLTYTTSGLGWRAAYSATLLPGTECRMQFNPEASIANRSGRNYRSAGIQLVAGQPNLGAPTVRMYSMAAPMPAAAEARRLPTQAPLGDYRSFTLPGTVTLPADTVTLTPLYHPSTLSCQREYRVEDGSAYSPSKPNTNEFGAQDYHDRPIASTLAFTAPAALPAGTLRAWTMDANGAPALLGEGSVADTPKDQRVAVQLGQSFDLRISRERTAFHVDARAHTMAEAYRITLTNGSDAAHTVAVAEHPDRWREWALTQSNIKPGKQTPQLLEFNVPVPAHGKATLTYSVRYTWTAQDQ